MSFSSRKELIAIDEIVASSGRGQKGHAECNDAGCGAQPFLRVYEGFHFNQKALFGEHNQLLFSRAQPAKSGVAQAQ
jgi:hypothetical protein